MSQRAGGEIQKGGTPWNGELFILVKFIRIKNPRTLSHEIVFNAPALNPLKICKKKLYSSLFKNFGYHLLLIAILTSFNDWNISIK